MVCDESIIIAKTMARQVWTVRKACDHMSETNEEGVTMQTDCSPYSTVVWVTVAGVRNSRLSWTYTLTEDIPGSPNDRTMHDSSMPTEKRCHSYPELCVWLYTYGCPPPPPDYFAPTHEEIEDGVESILRRVIRSNS